MIMMIAMITISVDNENNGDNVIMIKKNFADATLKISCETATSK